MTRINHRIRASQIRCISETGEQIGVISLSDALRRAEAAGMDLVEISPNATPPVCRIMDYGKFRYEENQKEKQAKKHATATALKEMKFHMNVEEHDYQTKLNHIRGFLEAGHRIKASLMFRGRENEHREFGFNLMNRLGKDCEGLGIMEGAPRLFGNNLVVMIRPGHAPHASTAPVQPKPPVAPAAVGAQAPRPVVVPVAVPRPPTPGAPPRP